MRDRDGLSRRGFSAVVLFCLLGLCLPGVSRAADDAKRFAGTWNGEYTMYRQAFKYQWKFEGNSFEGVVAGLKGARPTTGKFTAADGKWSTDEGAGLWTGGTYEFVDADTLKLVNNTNTTMTCTRVVENAKAAPAPATAKSQVEPAGPKRDLLDAFAKLAASSNYSWSIERTTKQDRRPSFPARSDKDGLNWYFAKPYEVVRFGQKGDVKIAIKAEGKWDTNPRGNELTDTVAHTLSPVEEIEKYKPELSNVHKTATGFTADWSSDAMIDYTRIETKEHLKGGTLKGTMTVTITKGLPSRIEKVFSIVAPSTNFQATYVTEIKDVGTSPFEVPAEVRSFLKDKQPR